MSALSIGPVTPHTCPSWCTVSPSEHGSQLRWSGRTAHTGEVRRGDGWQVRTSSVEGPTGGTEPAQLHVEILTSGGLTPAAAEELALTLLGACEQARD